VGPSPLEGESVRRTRRVAPCTYLHHHNIRLARRLIAEPVDLRQHARRIVVALSFTDSDLAALAAAWKSDGSLPSLRLANLRDLRHPMSVDLWIDAVARHAKVILVRILGGYDWWRYGCDQLAAVARAHGIKLALLPGECREEDLRLIEASTLPPRQPRFAAGIFP
jgi:cobaltochelatase CobN